MEPCMTLIAGRRSARRVSGGEDPKCQAVDELAQATSVLHVKWLHVCLPGPDLDASTRLCLHSFAGHACLKRGVLQIRSLAKKR